MSWIIGSRFSLLEKEIINIESARMRGISEDQRYLNNMKSWFELASQVAQRLKCLPAVQETWVLSLGWEDPLEKEMATHSSILAWRIPWMEEPGGLQSTASQRVRHD